MNKLNYKDAGVDVDANASWTGWIANTVKTNRKQHGINHVSPIGGFAGAMKLPPQIIEKIFDVAIAKSISSETVGIANSIRQALSSFSLVACTDGVGTKTMIGEKLNRLDTLGYDLLAMNVNDMVAGGATPIAFLDYIGCKGIMEGEDEGEDSHYRYQPFVEGLIKACREVNVELIGGETAEMKDNYSEFGSDLTGFALGIVTDDDIPQSNTIEEGDVIFAMQSSGIHSNGYSLVRKMLEKFNISLDDAPKELGGKTVADVLLEPTRLYVNQALAANATGFVKAMAHITGGGLIENIERVLPKDKKLGVQLDDEIFSANCLPPVFRWIKSYEIEDNVMLKTFNMGYGFVFISKGDYWKEIEEAVGETVSIIGKIVTK